MPTPTLPNRDKIHLWQRYPSKRGTTTPESDPAASHFYCGAGTGSEDGTYWTDDVTGDGTGCNLPIELRYRTNALQGRPEVATCVLCLSIFRTHGCLSLRPDCGAWV
jgi:hypothetical protein